MKNHILLRKWLMQTISENEGIITGSPVEIYAKLQDIWLKEVQVCLKDIAKEIIRTKD